MGLFGNGNDNDVVIGYRYYMGLLMGLCVGRRNPEDTIELRRIEVGDRLAWTGSQSQSGSFLINAPNLFGGDSNEGGVQTVAEVLMGDPDQGKSDYLNREIKGVIPAYRYLMSFIIRGGYIAANNPYPKPWVPEVRYIFKKWYSDKAQIDDTEANPAHIIYECLTNTDWGMGYPDSQIDSASFTVAADALHAENFGLSFLWVEEEPIEDFVQRVVDHIGAALTTSPNTGQFMLRLIRQDYNPSTLPVFDPSNLLEIDSYEGRGWGETINELTVIYTDPDTDKKASVTVQDMGNIHAQAQVVSKSVEYLGIRNQELAYRVALRDLKAAATPLAKLAVSANRQAWNLRPADVFKLSWPKLGILEEIYRVTSIDTGTLTNGTITINAVQDVFGLPLSTYGKPQERVWIPPNSSPEAALYRLVQEMPYFYLAQALGDASAQALDPAAGYLMSLATQPSGDSYNYDLLTKVGSAEYVNGDTVSWAPTAQLADNVDEVRAVLTISQLSLMEFAGTGLYLLGGSEFVEVTDVDLVQGDLTVNRGMLDTVPAKHPIGAILYDIAQNLGAPNAEYFDGEQVDAKMLTLTSMGKLEEASAPVNSVIMDERQIRPYPPGDVRLNGAYFPGKIDGELTVTWAHRDRLQQTSPDTLITQADPSIGPEPGTTYTIRVYGEPSYVGGPQPLIKTQTGETGTSWTYPEADEIADSGLTRLNALLRVEVESVRDGHTSRQFWSVITGRDIVTTDIDIEQITVPGDTDLALG